MSCNEKTHKCNYVADAFCKIDALNNTLQLVNYNNLIVVLSDKMSYYDDVSLILP